MVITFRCMLIVQHLLVTRSILYDSCQFLKHGLSVWVDCSFSTRFRRINTRLFLLLDLKLEQLGELVDHFKCLMLICLLFIGLLLLLLEGLLAWLLLLIGLRLSGTLKQGGQVSFLGCWVSQWVCICDTFCPLWHILGIAQIKVELLFKLEDSLNFVSLLKQICRLIQILIRQLYLFLSCHLFFSSLGFLDSGLKIHNLVLDRDIVLSWLGVLLLNYKLLKHRSQVSNLKECLRVIDVGTECKIVWASDQLLQSLLQISLVQKFTLCLQCQLLLLIKVTSHNFIVLVIGGLLLCWFKVGILRLRRK